MSKVINEMEKAKVPRSDIEKYLKYVEDPMERRNLEAKLESYQFWHLSNSIYVDVSLCNIYFCYPELSILNNTKNIFTFNYTYKINIYL